MEHPALPVGLTLYKQTQSSKIPAASQGSGLNGPRLTSVVNTRLRDQENALMSTKEARPANQMNARENPSMRAPPRLRSVASGPPGRRAPAAPPAVLAK